MRNSSIGAFTLLCLYFLFDSNVCRAAPTSSTAVMVVDNKFKNKDAVDLEQIVFKKNAETDESECHIEALPLWTSHVGNGIVCTPLIADLKADSGREVVTPTMRHYLEVLEGVDGHKEPGWPFTFAHSWMLAGPQLVDVDGNGINEIVITTKDGDVVAMREDGMPLYERTFRIPDLTVPRNWWEAEGANDKEASQCSFPLWKWHADQTQRVKSRNTGRKLLMVEDDEQHGVLDRIDEEASEGVSDYNDQLKGWLTDAGVESLELFLPTDTPETFVSHLREQLDPVQTERHQLYAELRRSHKDSQTVILPPHVLGDPVIGDLDNDGIVEMVIPVTYFYDSISEFDAGEVPFQKDHYVACAIVAYQPSTGRILFTSPLELTTDLGSFRAHITSAPVICDINNDGKLEVIVGTGVGSIFAINHEGKILDDFPFFADAIFGGVLVEDLDNDNQLEILVVDANSNVISFELDGSVTWEARASGVTNGPPAIGDIDGDGSLDVVVTTTKGHLFAFRGLDGKSVEHFPIRFSAPLYSPPTLLRMGVVPMAPSLHVLGTSTNGQLFIVDGSNGCVETLDLGERSDSGILADDLTGNGFLELVIATATGSVHALSTNIPYHPLNIWPSLYHGNGIRTSLLHQGIYILDSTRSMYERNGRFFSVYFAIINERQGKFPSKYRVEVSLGGSKVLDDSYSSTGEYSVSLSSPTSQITAVLEVCMTNEHGQRFCDSAPFSFNRYFYRSLKLYLLVPFAMSCFALVLGTRRATHKQ